MGLYEGILEERAEEERRRGRPLGRYRGIDSPVIDRLVENRPYDDPRYVADVLWVHKVMRKGGPHGLAAAYKFHQLKSKYPVEYAMLGNEIPGYGNYVQERLPIHAQEQTTGAD